jgi:hypothetical protein
MYLMAALFSAICCAQLLIILLFLSYLKVDPQMCLPYLVMILKTILRLFSVALATPTLIQLVIYNIIGGWIKKINLL